MNIIFLATIEELFQSLGPTEPLELKLNDYLFTTFSILICFVLSLVILFVYKKSYQTTVYNKSFAVSLPVVSMVTTVVIYAVSVNLILSLGMVGALSIVRFRTAIKNPFDTIFMYWAIGIGVTCGAGLIVIAVIATVTISIAVFLLVKLEVLSSAWYVIIRCEAIEKESEIFSAFKELNVKYVVKNKTIRNNELELTVELRKKSNDVSFINSINKISEVKSVIMLSHDGDYISE